MVVMLNVEWLIMNAYNYVHRGEIAVYHDVNLNRSLFGAEIRELLAKGSSSQRTVELLQ